MWNLAVLGFVRGHSFAGNGLIARNGRRIYPSLIVRPRRYCGLRLSIDPSDVSQLVIAEEFLQFNAYDLSKVPFIPHIVLDCGAHIGLFSLLCRAHFPSAQIKAFEPSPKNIEVLRTNVTVNDLAIEIIESAVSTNSGVGLFGAGASCGGHLIASNGVDGYRVALIDLKKHLPEEPARLLLKMDIEGSEEEVLPDVTPLLPLTTAIFFETHGGSESWERLSKLLEQSGFGTEVMRRHEQFTDGFALRLR